MNLGSTLSSTTDKLALLFNHLLVKIKMDRSYCMVKEEKKKRKRKKKLKTKKKKWRLPFLDFQSNYRDTFDQSLSRQ